jgi:DNA (cytosine-5)-methyltransferase 1
MNYIDLFAGAGGLSEGFIRERFNPVAHVEMDEAACNTLKTRTAYYYLIENNKKDVYVKYLKGEINRNELYSFIPENLLNSVINKSIGPENNKDIFEAIDGLIEGKNIDLIIGGPPCQAYSLPGRSRDKNKMVGDPRNYLFEQYAEFLKYYKPKYFVFENVVGLLSARSEDGSFYLDKMRDCFKDAGYTIEFKKLETKDYGILQNRKRIIIIGKKGKETGFYPEFKKWNPDVKVQEIFNDLPSLKAGEGNFRYTPYIIGNAGYLFDSNIRNGLDFTTHHVARPHTIQDKKIYSIAVEKWNNNKERLNYNDLPDELKTHENRLSFTDRFKVVAADLDHSQTVVAHIARDGHYYIHPDISQNRSISPREAARLQSFPDDYYFEGTNDKPSRTASFKQIGNAVPPLMAETIAVKVKELLLDYKEIQ